MSDIERTLPESQQPDSELEGGEMVAYDKAQQLAEQFEEIQTSTISDGVLKAPVATIEATSNNGQIAIEVDLPAETDTKRFYMDKPKSWSRDYDFVRWVEHHGYRAADFQGMIEKNVQVEVRREDGEYELVIPSRVRDKTKTAKEILASRALRILEVARDKDILIGLGVSAVSAFFGMLFVTGMVFQGDVAAFAFLMTITGGFFALLGMAVTVIVLE